MILSHVDLTKRFSFSLSPIAADMILTGGRATEVSRRPIKKR